MTSRDVYMQIGDGDDLYRPQCSRENSNNGNLSPMPQYDHKQVQMEDQNLANSNYNYPVFTGIEQLQRERIAQNENKGLIQMNSTNEAQPKKSTKKEKPRLETPLLHEANQPKVLRHETQVQYQPRKMVPEIDGSRGRAISLQTRPAQQIPVQQPVAVRIDNPMRDQINFISGTEKKPAQVHCPNCGSQEKTQVRSKYKNFGRLLSVGIWTMGGGLLSTIPCCFKSNWKYIHKCPKCQVTLSAIPNEDKWINN